MLLFLTLSNLCSSETVYLTFPKTNSGTTLTQQDLSLRINNVDVRPSEFFAVNTSSRDPALLSHPAGRRQYFILVDLIHLNAAQALHIRKLVQDFISLVPREDLVALAAITSEDGLRFFSGLIQDRSKIIHGWNAMGKVNLSGQTEGPEGNLYASSFSPAAAPPEFISDQEFTTNLKKYAVSEKAREQLAPLYVQAFVDMASLLSTVTGRKHLIVFGPGTDVTGLNVNLEELSKSKTEEEQEKEGTASEIQQQAEQHKTMREITTQTTPDRASMAAPLQNRSGKGNDANVVSRLIQGTGTQVHVFRPADQENNFLKDLAQKSKGLYKKIQDFPAVTKEILNSDTQYYVVAWNAQAQKDFHELQDLTLKAKNERIDTPPRWLAPKPISDYTALEKRIRLSQAIYKNLGSGNNYRFWNDIILDDGFNRISTFSQVSGKHLLGTKARKLDLVFYGFAMEEDGSLLDFASTPISLDLTNSKLIERLQKTGLKVWNVLFSGQKPVTIRTVVWNNETGDAITHSSIIDFDVSQFFLTTPFFPSSNFEWILWPAPDQALRRRGQEVLYPYQIGNNVFAPELYPTLQSAEKGKVVYFKMYNFTPGDKYPAVKLSLIAENGNAIEIQKFALLQQPRLIQRGGLEVFWTIDSIPGLHKGNYRFQVNVTDTAQGKSVIRDVLTAVE